MLIDRTHKKWAVGTLLALAFAALLYVPYHTGKLPRFLSFAEKWAIFEAIRPLNGASGKTVVGLIYGIVGSALMLFAGLIGVRRKFPRLHIGSAVFWLKGHIWLGLLSYPIIWFHAGLQWGGPLTTMLMALFSIVIVSGIYGLILQHLLPRTMAIEIPMETVAEQIDVLRKQLQKKARKKILEACGGKNIPDDPEEMSDLRAYEDSRHQGKAGKAVTAIEGEVKADIVSPSDYIPAGLVAKQKSADPKEVEAAKKVIEERAKKLAEVKGKEVPGSDPLRVFYLRDIRPFLKKNGAKIGPLTTREGRVGAFEHVRILLPQAMHAVLGELEEVCEERRQLDVQKRLHNWLHSWLLVHLPLAMALLVLSVAHAIMSLRY